MATRPACHCNPGASGIAASALKMAVNTVYVWLCLRLSSLYSSSSSSSNSCCLCILRTCSAAEYQLQNILSMPIYAFHGAISAMDADYMRTCHRICDRIFCENPHIAYFSAYINCVFKIAYAEIMPHMRKFAAYLRTSPHMRCRIFCIFAAYFSALFRQIPYIFPYILHQNGPHILRKISALWSCVWCRRSQERRPAFTPPWRHTKWSA